MTTLPAGGPSSRRPAKVLTTGPPGAGTTTFISTLRGSAPAAIERGAAPEVRAATRSDTAMDVARLEVADTRDAADVRRAAVALVTVAVERATARSAAVGVHARLGEVG
jgi:hypothetical protein